MDVRSLRQVMEICRSGSFARAAQALGMSQPALSRSIARLEDQLGVSLFDRSSGATRPTVFGLHVAERGAEVLNKVSAIDREVRQLFAGEAGRLGIGLGAIAADWFAETVLDTLLERFPRLGLTVVHGPPARLADQLAARELDVIVASAEGVTPRPDLIEQARMPLELVCLVRPSHPACARGAPFSLLELLDMPLAIPYVTAGLLRRLPLQLSAEQARNLRAFSSLDYRILCKICRATDTVMVAPRYLFAAEVEAGELRRLPVEFPGAHDSMMAVNAEGARSPVVGEVIQLMRRTWPGPVYVAGKLWIGPAAGTA